MGGLALSREYFDAIARPRLEQDFPELYGRAAAGLAGNGSECFGYDDEISRDHDWGADFFLWLPEADRPRLPGLSAWRLRLLDENPPGFARERSEYGARIGVMTTGDFYRLLIGFPEGPIEIMDWRRVPEENLAMAVNGAVFMDNLGEFTRIRKRLLEYYPEDLRKKKIAAHCMAIANTGQYNHMRTAGRGDWVTVRTVLSRFNDSVISLVFLLNRTFRPYYKWAYRMMSGLPLLGGDIAPLLLELATAGGFDDESLRRQQWAISRICGLLINELRRQRLSRSDDWFMTTHAEEVRRSIGDERLRSLPTQYE